MELNNDQLNKMETDNFYVFSLKRCKISQTMYVHPSIETPSSAFSIKDTEGYTKLLKEKYNRKK